MSVSIFCPKTLLKFEFKIILLTCLLEYDCIMIKNIYTNYPIVCLISLKSLLTTCQHMMVLLHKIISIKYILCF